MKRERERFNTHREVGRLSAQRFNTQGGTTRVHREATLTMGGIPGYIGRLHTYHGEAYPGTIGRHIHT